MSCIGDETLLLPIAFLHRSHYPSGKENDQEKDGEKSDEGYEDAEVTRGGMGGGTLYAYDDTVTTAGESSAAIRSDRGGGTMVVDGGSYTTNGTGSPAIYSTADISAHDATLTANNSEAVCIEGANTIRLFDCSLSGNMQDNDQNDCTWNVILYQSMSGDSEEGNSTFEMTGGSLTAGNGGDGSCSMYIDSGSTWIVTGDSTVTNLYNAGTIADADGNSVTIKGTDGTVYQEGSGSVTITVSAYSTDVDLSGASSADSWSHYEVAKPEELS